MCTAGFALLALEDGDHLLRGCVACGRGHLLSGPSNRFSDITSSFALKSYSFADKTAETCRLRNHRVFGRARPNTPRPRSKVRARTCTRNSTRRSTFLGKLLLKLGSQRRRAPGAHQRGGYNRYPPISFYHTQILLAAQGRFRSLRRTRR